MSPDLVPLYHDFAELNNRLIGENLQLNIVLYQGAVSGSLFGVRIKTDAVYYYLLKGKIKL